jgi:uncharacterized protein (UPF0147 family)
VSFVDDEGVERTIDFLGHPGGLDAEETVRMSIGAEIDVEGLPQPLTFRVMHPVQCLESRAFNVAKLPGYDTEHSLDQLRAAIACAREFLVDLLAEPDNVRTVLKLNERIFALAAYKAGLDVFATKGIDVLGAIVVDPRLPQAFREKRYPQIREVVAQRRARHGTSGRDRG